MSATSPVGLEIWNAVLLPFFQDDRVLTKLWRCSRTMQRMMKKRVTHLRCHVRPATCPTKRYLQPAFTSQLKNLQVLKFVAPDINGYDDDLFEMLIPKIVWNTIPESVTELHITRLDLLVDDADKLLRFIYDRPNMKLIRDVDDIYDGVYRKLLSKLITKIKMDFRPLVGFGYFTTIIGNEMVQLYVMWDTLDPEIKLWLQRHWCPLVHIVYFPNSAGLPKSMQTQALEQWCYHTFPNITKVTNAESLPATVRQYISNTSTLLLPILNTCSLLATLSIEVSSHLLPKVFPFPATLSHCSIHVEDCHTDEYSLLHALIAQLPATLVKFKLQLLNYLTMEAVDYWDSFTITGLPRALQVLDIGNFPTDVDLWKLLSPKLTKFKIHNQFQYLDLDNYRGNIVTLVDQYKDRNYQVVSPHLIDIKCGIRSEPRVAGRLVFDDPMLQLSTLTRFQSLTCLYISVIDQYALSNGCCDLPVTLRKLTLKLNYRDNTVDYIAGLVFPPQLENLAVYGRGSMMDVQHWHPLPATVQRIFLSELNIRSLPTQWPPQLCYLNLEGSSGSGSINPKSLLSCNINPALEDDDRDSSDDNDDDDSDIAYIKTRLKRIPNIIPSLMAVPPNCIIHYGEVQRGDVFIIVDYKERKFDVGQIYE